MSFFNSIEKLRNKPERERRIICFTGASTVFLLIFSVWLTTFQLNSEQVKNEETYNTLSPLDSLKNMSSRFVQDIKEKVGGSDKDNDPLNFTSESKTESAAIHTAVSYEILNKDTAGTTTKDNSLNNEEKNGILGTSSDMTKSATNSEDVKDTTEDEGKDPPTGGE